MTTDVCPAVGAPQAKEPCRVLIVDDHRTFAELMAFSLDAEDDFVCVGRAETVREAVALADALEPDVVVMDYRLPDGDGIGATTRILARHPQMRVLMLTAYAEPEVFARAAAAGVSGFLVKDGALADVLSALRAARCGNVTVTGELLAHLTDRAQSKRGDGNVAPVLTAREDMVLRLLADGQDVRAIASTLTISVNTCRDHVKRLREKLGAHSQLQAVATAARMGMLTPPGPTVPRPRASGLSRI